MQLFTKRIVLIENESSVFQPLEWQRKTLLMQY